MSRRQRTARDSAQRLKVARDKALRRRSRARRVAGAAAAAVTLAGGGTAAISPAQAATGHLAGASLAGCTSATTPDSDPSYLTDVGGDLYFTAFDGEHGQALWKTDGTESGTVLLKEFGSSGGYDDEYGYGSGASDLTEVDGRLFFTVDGDGTDELWRSDGTAAGTVRVRSFASVGRGYKDEDSSALTAVGDTLFFVADDGKHGEEVWRSDGTKSGTVLVKDIGSDSDTGYDYYYSEGPGNLTPAGDTLFFTASDGTHGEELWRSDGTKAGTVQVRNIRPGSYSSDARSLTVVGDDIYFTARDGVHGRELWTSDGTKAGTVLVKDIRPGGGTAVSGPLVATDDGTVFFGGDDGTGGRDLWRSDGTSAGTVLVKNLGTVGDDDYYGLGDMVADGNTLFFAGSDDAHGLELWTSDGTEAGTVMVKDIRPGDYDGYPSSLTEVDGEVYFVARDGVHGSEVWRSDGTKAGTVLVKDVDPDANSSRPRSLTESGGTLYFAEDDSIHGQELWASDGTEAGTVLVKDINTGGAFLVSSKAVPNTDKGTVRVRVVTDGAGTLSVARNRWIRGSSRDVGESGDNGVRFNVTLEPTRAAKRVLRREGELRVSARFTFSSCGGAVNSVTHHYTLRMG